MIQQRFGFSSSMKKFEKENRGAKRRETCHGAPTVVGTGIRERAGKYAFNM